MWGGKGSNLPPYNYLQPHLQPRSLLLLVQSDSSKILQLVVPNFHLVPYLMYSTVPGQLLPIGPMGANIRDGLPPSMAHRIALLGRTFIGLRASM